jgi:glyoxylase-like metal-dependent hydrolase (beta-lactamase superfamily II)
MFEISRRDVVFGAAAAYAMFGLSKPIAFIGVAEAQPAQAPAFRKYKVGDFEVFSLYDGVWEKPHDETFVKDVSLDQTKRALRAWGQTDAFVAFPITTLAVKTPAGLVLIDTGTRGALGPKSGLLPQSMAAAGIDPKTAKTIIISHFHGDHISGMIEKDTNAPLFPDAEIIVPATEMKWWTQPLESLPAGRQGGARLVQASLAKWKNVRVADDSSEPVPGIRLVPAFGHTQGHTGQIISSGGKTFFSTVDAATNPALFLKNPNWLPSNDHVPEQAAETRRKVFDQAVADKMMVSGYHWGLPNVGTISKDGNGYAFVPAEG